MEEPTLLEIYNHMNSLTQSRLPGLSFRLADEMKGRHLDLTVLQDNTFTSPGLLSLVTEPSADGSDRGEYMATTRINVGGRDHVVSLLSSTKFLNPDTFYKEIEKIARNRTELARIMINIVSDADWIELVI